MKRFLTAFTLAEVLITLAIIGVVARITLPALMSSASKQQAATALMKAINTIELTNATILADRDAQSLSGGLGMASATADNYLQSIAPFMKGDLKSLKVEGDGNDNKTSIKTLTTKDGIMLFKGTTTVTVEDGKTTTFPEQYTGTNFTLVVDTNGMAKPNKWGEDRFEIMVDETGAVIAPGSYTYACYVNDNFNEQGTGTVSAAFESSCKNNEPCKNTFFAAGAVVDNGGKILYKIDPQSEHKLTTSK